MSKFELFDEIPMDRGHTLDQMTSHFRTIKEGLPELVKNSKDQYSRLSLPDRSARQILVLASGHAKLLAVIDFAGAGPEEFGGWVTWSSRTANRSDVSADIEGGHGNGGKAFMVRGSSASSYMESCAGGRRTVMGFQNDVAAAKYRPGYLKESGLQINNILEPDPTTRLQTILARFGLKVSDLPDRAQKAFLSRKSFTAVVLEGVAEWTEKRKSTIERLIRDLPSTLASHGQVALTLESCDVWVIGDSGLLTPEPLAPQHLEPFPGFETPRLYDIPAELKDPQTSEFVATGCTPQDYLKLETSARTLRISEDLKARNVIRVRNERNVVASWPIPSLGIMVASSSFVYGEIRLSSLSEDHLADAHRSELADTPLSRSVKEWVQTKVESLAEDIQRAQMRERKQEDVDRANQTLAGLRDLMREFLEPDDVEGEMSDKERGGPGSGPGTKPARKRGKSDLTGSLLEILLEPTTDIVQIAAGTNVPLVYRCFGIAEDGMRKQVKRPDLILRTDNGAFCDFIRGFVIGRSPGVGMVWLHDPETNISSNRILLEVFNASGAQGDGPNDPILQGQRVRIPIRLNAPEGYREGVLIEAEVADPEMGTIGRHGVFTAGRCAGTAEIRVKYGAGLDEYSTINVMISSVSIPGPGGGPSGGNIPEILLCGDEAPGMEDYPFEQRTHPGGDAHPTIIEEPQFPHVVWINPESKESFRVRKSAGSSTGMSSIATKTYMQFVALKCFEILKRLVVRQRIKDELVTEAQFRDYFAQAEIDCAKFIDAAYDVSENLLGSGVEER